MNPKLLRRLLASAVVVGAFAGLYYYTHAPLLRIRLKDGTEIRVLKVAYGTGANHEHEFAPPSQLKLRLIHLLPQKWQDYFSPKSQQPTFRTTSSAPKVFVWWEYDIPSTIVQRPTLKAVVTPTDDNWHFIYMPVGNRPAQRLFDVERVEGNRNPLGGPYLLAPGEPNLLVFSRPEGASRTLTVHLTLSGEPVSFTVPIPAPSE